MWSDDEVGYFKLIVSFIFKILSPETFLVVQWLRLRAPSSGGLSSIPG